MAKNRAEIQRAYRERRIAKEGNEYRSKEAKRVQKYYVPTAKLTPSDRIKRREAGRKAVRMHRQKLKSDDEDDMVVVDSTSL